MDTRDLKNFVIEEAREYVQLVIEGAVENDRNTVQPKNFDYEDTIIVLQTIGTVYLVDETDKDYVVEFQWPDCDIPGLIYTLLLISSFSNWRSMVTYS